MPDTKSSQLTWSAKAAGDRIVIVTTEPRFDASVRKALRREPYELITVADFASHERELIDTCLAIVHIQYNGLSPTILFRADNEGWSEYPLIGVVSDEDEKRRRTHFGLRDRFDFTCESYSHVYELIMPESGLSKKLVRCANEIIDYSRIPKDQRVFRI